MPKKFPPEFKRDVVTVARRGDLTKAEVAADFGIAEATVHQWCRQADIGDGIKDGLTSAQSVRTPGRRRPTDREDRRGAPPIAWHLRQSAVHAELRLGEGISIGRKRVARLMRQAGLEGVYRRRRRGCTTRNPAAESSDDLVNRRFRVEGPDRLWVTDITEHPTVGGRVYLGVVLDGGSRRVVGWSIADHLRSELVVDAYYNAVAESFFGTLQLELLDRHVWASRDQLASAIFEWIEVFYNPQTPSLERGDAQSRRPRNRPRGMITTQPPPSAKPGEGQTRFAETS
jgi:putative transposase